MEEGILNKQVLIVDSSIHTRKILRTYFEKENFQIKEAELGLEALLLTQKNRYIMVIINWTLTDTSGDELCRQLKLRGTVPLIIFIGDVEENERIQGFVAGADDFIARPFNPNEVVLRAKAMITRLTGTINSQSDLARRTIVFSSVTIDLSARKVNLDGKEVHLTLKEFDLLYFFAQHKGEVFTREELLAMVWGKNHSSFADYRTVDTHVKRLRQKFSNAFSDKNGLIQTVWGYGYKFNVKSEK
ncbi:response regulator transcription factor [Paenibacillus piscarius]|uniref:response regulator transcription factor n=1 Tax=Paenibacillus piscarius TaxID=1089681 RepID=UPI001EE97327|nr:response regulator transcription factor [Paenibacillus piscarius]